MDYCNWLGAPAPHSLAVTWLAPKKSTAIVVCGHVPRGKALLRSGARVGDALFVSGRLGKPWDRRITPRLALGKALRGSATSCIDLSDGLSLDLHRLCLASGVAAEVDRVPIMSGVTIERALNGGEDYELLFTMPPGTTRIGKIIRGERGRVLFKGQVLPPRGYDHFTNLHTSSPSV